THANVTSPTQYGHSMIAKLRNTITPASRASSLITSTIAIALPFLASVSTAGILEVHQNDVGLRFALNCCDLRKHRVEFTAGAESEQPFEFSIPLLFDLCIRAIHACRITVEPSRSSRDPR